MEKLYDKIKPWWITGFIDGEGCFYVGFEIIKNKKISVRISFSVSQNHSSSATTIQKIAEVFASDPKSETSNVRVDRKTVKYETRNLDNLIKNVIPHFDAYPLQSNKQKSFLAWKQIAFMVKNENPLSKQPLKMIVDLAFDMNLDESQRNRRGKPKEFYIQFLENN
jgi:LAGLIDADG endonuclease